MVSFVHIYIGVSFSQTYAAYRNI